MAIVLLFVVWGGWVLALAAFLLPGTTLLAQAADGFRGYAPGAFAWWLCLPDLAAMAAALFRHATRDDTQRAANADIGLKDRSDDQDNPELPNYLFDSATSSDSGVCRNPGSPTLMGPGSSCYLPSTRPMDRTPGAVIAATRQVLANGLALLGVSAPDSM